MTVASRRILVAALLLILAGATACARGDGPVILATTSSVANSGLLELVLAAYPGGTVRPVLVGSGRAIDMLAARAADVVISHAPAREAAALSAHPSWSYRKILYNDFLIVGPPEDPAAVSGAANAIEAMTRIAASGARFLSRGDESGTHQRERELWASAGTQPKGSRLVVAGAGMGQTLRVAGSTGAYTLTDRGTYEALRASIQLRVLFEGDPQLLNTYAVIADPRNPSGEEFARWLSEGAGREVMAEALRLEKVKGFLPWPRNVAGSQPLSSPR